MNAPQPPGPPAWPPHDGPPPYPGTVPHPGPPPYPAPPPYPGTAHHAGPPPATGRSAAAIGAAVLAFVLAPMVLIGAAYSWFVAGLDSAFRGGAFEGEANMVALLSFLCFFPLVAGGVLVLLRIDRWVLVSGAVAVAALAGYWLARGAQVLDTGDSGWRMAVAVGYGVLAGAAVVLALLPAVGRALAVQQAERRAARRWAGPGR